MESDKKEYETYVSDTSDSLSLELAAIELLNRSLQIDRGLKLDEAVDLILANVLVK